MDYKIQALSQNIDEISKCKDDIIHFCNYIYLTHPIKDVIKFTPNTQQKEVLRSYQHDEHTIVLAARQRGKTSLAAIFILWYSTFFSDRTIYLGAPTHQMAVDMLRTIRNMYMMLPMWLQVNTTFNNKHQITWENGTKILASSIRETSIRGYTVNLVYLDEVAFVKPKEMETFWASLAPCLQHQHTKVLMASSISNTRGFFDAMWETAMNGDNRMTPKMLTVNSARITTYLDYINGT